MISLKLTSANANTKLKICLCVVHIYDTLTLYYFPSINYFGSMVSLKKKQEKKMTGEKVVGVP